MTRVIALMALAALGLAEAPVHEPVHGRRQTISVVVTQRSARSNTGEGGEDPARGDPGRGPLCTAELSRIWIKNGACDAAGPASVPALSWEARRRTPGQTPHGALIEMPNQSAIAIASGPSPTGIGGPGVLVAVAIGVTVPSCQLVT
jgi:hypothetical protein